MFCPGLVKSSIFDAERNRPASHGERQPVKPPPLRPGAPPLDLMGVAMDPLEAGRLVLEGIRRNDLYILTHPEFAPAVRERVRLLMASFSKRPVPKDRAFVTQAIIPGIYRAELGKRGLLKSGARKKRPAGKAKTMAKAKASARATPRASARVTRARGSRPAARRARPRRQ